MTPREIQVSVGEFLREITIKASKPGTDEVAVEDAAAIAAALGSAAASIYHAIGGDELVATQFYALADGFAGSVP